jgi:hypothetical protein
MEKLRGFFSQMGPLGSLAAAFFLGSSSGFGAGVFLLLGLAFGAMAGLATRHRPRLVGCPIGQVVRRSAMKALSKNHIAARERAVALAWDRGPGPARAYYATVYSVAKTSVSQSQRKGQTPGSLSSLCGPLPLSRRGAPSDMRAARGPARDVKPPLMPGASKWVQVKNTGP